MDDIIKRDSSNLLQLLEYLKKIPEKRFSYGRENVFTSSVVYNKRSNEYYLQWVNAQIVNFCKENNCGFIDHRNINRSHLYDNGVG